MILLVLLVITISLLFYTPESKNVNKTIFTTSNVEEIDRIEISNGSSEIILTSKGRQWELNDNYTAHVARINDLFVILEKINARRKVSKEVQSNLKTLFDANGATINIYAGDLRVKQLRVVENNKGTLSYFIDNDGTGYICNITGYNYHIAQLFNLDVKGWRSNYVFSSNWSTLEKLGVSYPNRDGFEIRYDPKGYYVNKVVELDTAKMYSYLEQISFLQVDQFLEIPPESLEEEQPTLNLSVYDAADNSISISFYNEDGKYLGLIDSTEWAIFNKRDIMNLSRNTQWFEAQN